MDFKLHHHPQHKHSVVRTLIDRAKNITSTGEEISSESKRALNALSAYKYPTHFIRNGHQSNTEQETGVKDADQQELVILLYAKGFSEIIAKVFKGFNIKVEHKPILPSKTC